jgi:hypothetical protein
MLLVKDPVPVPFVVWSSEVVGFDEVLQHTPLALTASPPSAVTLPPDKAVVGVMPEGEVVVTVGVVE